MTGQDFDNIVVVSRKTQLEELVTRFNTVSQARFYLEHAGQSFEPIQAAHDAQYRAIDAVRNAIPRDQKHQFIDRSLVPRFFFGYDDLVIVVGQDGLISNTAKYLDGQPILGVNPDPTRIDGILLPFQAETILEGLTTCFRDRARISAVSLAKATLADGQSLLAFNDFFIGAKSHVSARYRIDLSGQSENQSSSGIIVSTGAGSTGWLQSIYAGAAGVIEALGGRAEPPPNHGRLAWDTDRLVYSVREPFPSIATGATMVHGAFTNESPLEITSKMETNGVIFSDGVEADYLSFNSGATATITIASKQAHLVMT